MTELLIKEMKDETKSINIIFEETYFVKDATKGNIKNIKINIIKHLL